MNEGLSVFAAWLLANRGKVSGTGLGILVGLFTLKYGLMRALFLLLCLGIGYFVGDLYDRQGEGPGLLESILASRRRQR